MIEQSVASTSSIKHDFAHQAVRDCGRMTLMNQSDSAHVLSGWLPHCLQAEVKMQSQ